MRTGALENEPQERCRERSLGALGLGPGVLRGGQEVLKTAGDIWLADPTLWPPAQGEAHGRYIILLI